MPLILIPLRPILGVLQIGIKSKGYREPVSSMSDSEHSTVTYTSVSEAIRHLFNRSRSCLLEFIQWTMRYSRLRSSQCLLLTHLLISHSVLSESDPEEDLEEDDEEDPEEDLADYPADRGDDDDDDDAEEEEHLVSTDPAVVAYSADQDPYLAYRVTARMSIRPGSTAPFPLPRKLLRDCLGLTYSTHHLLSILITTSQYPLRHYQLPITTNPLALHMPCCTTPGPGYEVEESLAAGTARQFGPATARTYLYGFAEMCHPGDCTTTLEGTHCPSDGGGGQIISCRLAADRRRQLVISDLLKADYRRQRQLVEALKILKSLKTQIDRASETAGDC
ncbi:hypothetical protein Tco_0169882 [Tanacetum coccineum]